MIKVGDKLHHQGKEWNVEFAGKPFIHLKHEDDFIIESSHIFWNKLYVEQKQRADELENQWNDLRNRLVEIYKNDTETGKQYLRSFLCLLDELEGKENVFETVQNLEN